MPRIFQGLILDFIVGSKDTTQNSEVDKNKTIIFESLIATGMHEKSKLRNSFTAESAAFYEIFHSFISIVDYNCNCFKIVNTFI